MTRSDLSSNRFPCPVCGGKTRKVSRETVQGMLVEPALGRLDGDATFRFCPSPSCEVVYADALAGTRFLSSDLRVEVFQKSRDPSRLVCYCFEHSVAEVEEQVRRSGTSTIPAEIADLCRQGLDRCEELNPQGSCCLGNVRRVVAEAQSRDGKAAAEVEASADDCCTVPAAPKPRDDASVSPRSGLWAAGGALVAAVLSSACCWLPLLAISLGVSAAGVAGFFERYRVLFLAVTAAMLGLGFYLTYFRKPACGPDGSCRTAPKRKVQRFNKVMLWLATALVVAFAAFPSYVGALLGGDEAGSGVGLATAGERKLSSWTYDVEGMTCEGCARTLTKALSRVPRVVRAEVVYKAGRARVFFAPGAPPDEKAVLKAIVDAGYKARRST